MYSSEKLVSSLGVTPFWVFFRGADTTSRDTPSRSAGVMVSPGCLTVTWAFISAARAVKLPMLPE